MERRRGPRAWRFEQLEARQVLSAQAALITDATPYNEAFVEAVYHDALGRSADPAAMTWAMQQLNDGQLRVIIPEVVVHSDEYFTQLVQSAYQQRLGRDADPAALKFWVAQMRSGATDNQLAAALVASDEFYQHAGGTDADWVKAAYQSLLGRPAEAGAIAWAAEDLASGMGRGGLAMLLAQSPEREREVVREDYSRILGTTIDASGLDYWSTSLADGQATDEGLLTTLMGVDAYYQQRTGAPPTVVPMPVNAAFWQERDAQIDSQAAQGNAQMLFLGDSITQFWENAGQTVWERNYAGLAAINAGIMGDRTQNVLWRLDHGNLDGASPKVAVVMVGINNLALGDGPQDVAAGVSAIVETLRQRLPETKVLVLGILPASSSAPNASLRQEIATTNQMIQGLADGQNVFYLDMAGAFTTASGAIKPQLYQPYLVHLSTAGYAAWTQTMAPDLRYLLDLASLRN